MGVERRFKDNAGNVIDPYPWDPFNLVVLGTTFAWSVSANVTKALDCLDDYARAHANYRRDRRELSRSVQDTLDRL
jgi:acyl-homoserine lactone acylase PvdQ